MEIAKDPSYKVLLSVIIIVVVASLIFFIVSLQRNLESPALSVAEQKQAFLDRLQDTDQKPLTHEESVNMINFVSRGGATYSEEEKAMITKALRAQ